MEEKLLTYRRRKRQKELLINFKNKFLSMIPLIGGKEKREEETCVIEPFADSCAQQEYLNDAALDSYSDEVEEDFVELPTRLPENKCLKYTLWVVYFLFWGTCYAIAIELKFGLVYLLLSALFGVYFNTRTGPRRKNEISAYSVFNKDCESIDGTLKAEQFEREIRFGATSVR